MAVTLSIEENNKINTLWKHPASVVFFPTGHVASITRYLTDCRSKMSFDEKKTTRVLLAEMRLDRDANFRWSPQANTITNMRRRDCNLPKESLLSQLPSIDRVPNRIWKEA
jgi:hypothetical protein